MKYPLQVLIFAALNECYDYAFAALSQGQEAEYLANFDAMNAASYSAITDEGKVPPNLMSECKNNWNPPTRNIIVLPGENGYVSSSQVSQQCGSSSACIIPLGVTYQVDSSINLSALVVQGSVEWTDDTQVDTRAFLCAGFVAVEGHGKWMMDLQDKDAFIYLKDNGATHSHLRTRAFGSYAASSNDYPMIDINGRDLVRTWSLLAEPLKQNDVTLKLMHNPYLMGWRVGDRIAIAPTEVRATGQGEAFTISKIWDDGTLQLDKNSSHNHDAKFKVGGNSPALLSAEVVNLSRNIVISGDDFKNVGCDSSLPEAVPGEQTSVLGCRCSSFRSKCTMGLHTAIMNGGEARITNTRIEKCGQRGVEGKYCLHFHKLHDCPTCLFKNNAIEYSHQRGIIVHSTHSSLVEQNVLYNVRGAGIYIEDGNELYNDIKYNVVICPFIFGDRQLHGCTLPGTSNRIADTSDNQSGIFSRAFTNGLIGNRVSNAFNGMFLNAGSIGRGESYGKVCEADALLGRVEGNTFHGNGRFGTYTLGGNYAKKTDQSILTNGHNIDKSLCDGFDNQGYARGQGGHYEAGEIQHSGHHSYNSAELIYWKETVNFKNGCSAHITGGSYAGGNLALPDQSTFLIEDTLFGDGVSFEANHHCNVGTTGVLCQPQYIFHNIEWKNYETSNKWIWFQYLSTQSHSANQAHGGVFTLSPPNTKSVMDGEELQTSIFPPGYVSLVSEKYTYLLDIPNNVCMRSGDISATFGRLYSYGILCKLPLRSLKIYSRGLLSGTAPDLFVEMYYNKGSVDNQIGPSDASQLVGFHQVGNDYASRKQGYSFPIVPGLEHSYRLSLATGNGDIPLDWVVEFSDFILGNRFGSIDYTNLSLNGFKCGNNGEISSQHDRRYIWSGDKYLSDEAWGNTGACAVGKPPDKEIVDCKAIDDGVLPALECPELCNNECDEMSSYCDCGSAKCQCKAGFYGEKCLDDLCAAARCEHGSCSAKYLGGDLPVTSNACICDEGWSGPLCQFNPCLGKTCGNGKCVAISDTESECVCDAGFSGNECTESCDGKCIGSYPFGCATYVNDVVSYGCFSTGGCYYLKVGENYPYGGFCTYKTVTQEQDCLCGDENDCELSRRCNDDGTCSTPQFLPDGSSCNSVPDGTCQSGVCTDIPSPTVSPATMPPTASFYPSSSPVISTPKPSDSPSSHCGCTKCTDAVWNTPASDGAGVYTCGDRISWLTTPDGGSMSELDACRKVAGQEFNDGPCGPYCDPSLCDLDPVSLAPTELPTSPPSMSPSRSPTLSPSSPPSSSPVISTSKPSDSSSSRCGCTKCTDAVWNTPASDGAGVYTCGDRISWLTTPDGGSMSELDACKKVAGQEFNDGPCGPYCDPSLCDLDPVSLAPTELPTSPPSMSPSRSPTLSPSSPPSSSPVISTPKPSDSPSSHCRCTKCTDAVWNTPAGDGAGVYTCGDRISWLTTPDGGSMSELDACRKVAGQEFNDGPCGPYCDPSLCDLDPVSLAPTELPTSPPSMSPSRSPTLSPSSPPSSSPVISTPKPSDSSSSRCGCTKCTDAVWNTPASDGAGVYTCGDRISWLTTPDGGSMSELDACRKVAGQEFNDGPCGPYCDPSLCDLDPVSLAPTELPRSPPSMSPSRSPTLSPSSPPSSSPVISTPKPSDSSSSHCGCTKCTESIWNALAGDGAGIYTCGDRISWLTTPDGGSMSELDACTKVSIEFPGVCGPSCDPSRCDWTLNNPDPSTLIWEDEFNVDGLPDPTKWSYDLGDGCDIGLCNWGNSEVAYYTNNLSNVYVSNGTLSIVAKQESGYSLPYTSARIVTRGKHAFRYGRVQFRANLSKCKAIGTWPALWMLPESRVYGGWPRSGEIDVMETVGHQPNRFYGTIHTEAYNGMIGTQKGGSVSVSKEDYHVFEVNWEEDKIQFAVDQQIYYEYPRGDSTSVWPFDQEFHLIMNIAVGGTWGGQQGIDSDAFNGSGQVMEVDWVRVYGEAAPTSSPVSSIDPSSNFCGCSSCSKEVWDTIASDSAGDYTCGGRITWLQSSAGGSMSEFDACRQIAGQEFKDGPCGPYCDPSTCI